MKARRKLESEAGIAIVGPGRLGQALGRLLNCAGFSVQFVVSRRLAAAQRATRFIGSGRPVTLDLAELNEARVFLLTVSDGAIAPVAEHLAAGLGRWRGKVVLHTCGSLPSSVLAPLGEKGAAIGSLHPYQTIPSPAAGTRNLRNCFWAIEGDPAARRVAERWVRALGGTAFTVRPADKILYHASAFLVCPTLVALMDFSQSLLRQCGVGEKISRPMLARFVAETVESYRKLGARGALTGPVARGDWESVRQHLKALKRHAPEVVPAYKALLRPMLKLAGRKPPRDLARMLD